MRAPPTDGSGPLLRSWFSVPKNARKFSVRSHPIGRGELRREGRPLGDRSTYYESLQHCASLCVCVRERPSSRRRRRITTASRRRRRRWWGRRSGRRRGLRADDDATAIHKGRSRRDRHRLVVKAPDLDGITQEYIKVNLEPENHGKMFVCLFSIYIIVFIIVRLCTRYSPSSSFPLLSCYNTLYYTGNGRTNERSQAPRRRLYGRCFCV